MYGPPSPIYSYYPASPHGGNPSHLRYGPASYPVTSNNGLASLDALISRLGTQTRMHPQGMLIMNRPLVEQIVRYREQAVPALYRFFDQHLRSPGINVLAITEALFTAQRLAESKVSNVKQLYGVTSRLNTITDPLILTYLGGFYEKLAEYESFGPTLSALINMAVTRFPPPNLNRNPSVDAPESLGGAVLEMIAKKTARETVNELRKQLRPEVFRP